MTTVRCGEEYSLCGLLLRLHSWKLTFHSLRSWDGGGSLCNRNVLWLVSILPNVCWENRMLTHTKPCTVHKVVCSKSPENGSFYYFRGTLCLDFDFGNEWFSFGYLDFPSQEQLRKVCSCLLSSRVFCACCTCGLYAFKQIYAVVYVGCMCMYSQHL